MQPRMQHYAPKEPALQVVLKIKPVMKITTFFSAEQDFKNFLVIPPYFIGEETKPRGSQIHLDPWNSAVQAAWLLVQALAIHYQYDLGQVK